MPTAAATGRRRTAPTRAERQARTRTELVDAAERLFSGQGFHATSLDSVADAAGYTKGAVYSNFASKEDLFFAVYERRVDRHVEQIRPVLARARDGDGDLARALAEIAGRREHDTGWLAVFLEFWTHALRHPEHRERFAAAHARAAEPFADALSAVRGLRLQIEPRHVAMAGFALATGMGLERLTRPDDVDVELAVRVQELWARALIEPREG